MLRVIGCDPGPKQTAMGTVGMDPNGRPHFESCELVESNDQGLLAGLANAPQLVAIETVEGEWASPFRVAALFETSRVAGVIEGICVARTGRHMVRRKPARDWRGELCRKPNASDAAIAIVLEDLLGIDGRLNAHERDALGVAIAVGWAELGRRVQLSPVAEMRLLQQLATEQAKRTTKMRAKRAAKKAAAPREGIGGSNGK